MFQDKHNNQNNNLIVNIVVIVCDETAHMLLGSHYQRFTFTLR
jgi:hypothetical protein